MIKHIVLFQFRDPDVCVPVARQKLHALEAVIPEIVSMETGRDFLGSARSYDMALIVTFRDRAGLEAYDKHPAHQVVREYIHAHRTASVAVDFEQA